MPEGLEAEIWTRDAQSLVGRTMTDVWCDDRVAPSGLRQVLDGAVIGAVRRRGKVMLVDTDQGTLGLHFGMTGRVEVDGHAPIGRLEYASGADRPEWDRLRLWTIPAHGGRPALRMNDPRRLGRLSLDEDLCHLGPDALSLTTDELAAAIARRTARIKTVLLDQSAVAGLGNLCADEVLLHAGIAPHRRCDELTPADVSEIVAACRERLPLMLGAGGSTCGDLDPAVRKEAGPCPRDGADLRRESIDGRTAVWCPAHQV